MWKTIFNEENLKNIKLTGVFILVFFVGFGTASAYNILGIKSSELFDYNTYLSEEKAKKTEQNTINSECPVKGNISGKTSKIYHITGGQFYENLTAEVCFQNEASAQLQGFKKSSR